MVAVVCSGLARTQKGPPFGASLYNQVLVKRISSSVAFSLLHDLQMVNRHYASNFHH